MIKTKITEMFGIDYPIICGAMMWISRPELCAAVSNAGGMGNITAAIYKTENEFRDAIKEAKKLTDKPFTVNVTLLPSISVTPEHHKMYLNVCAQEKVAALEISGAPIDKACGPEYIDMLKKAGVKIFHKVGSVRHAVHAEKAGYDGIFAAGIEEGGHPLNDDVTTMLLTPRIVDTVNLPVITAGGIGDGKTMAAALMLGADAVMMATRFMATKECYIHENIKQELVDREEHHTTLICKSINLQGRALKNKTVECVLDVEKRGGGIEELIPLITGKKCEEAWKTGDTDIAPMMVGQSIGLIKDIPTCKELLDRMMSECKERIQDISKKLV